MRLCFGLLSALLAAMAGAAGVLSLCLLFAWSLYWIPWDVKFFIVCFAFLLVVLMVYLVLRRAIGARE